MVFGGNIYFAGDEPCKYAVIQRVTMLGAFLCSCKIRYLFISTPQYIMHVMLKLVHLIPN